MVWVVKKQQAPRERPSRGNICKVLRGGRLDNSSKMKNMRRCLLSDLARKPCPIISKITVKTGRYKLSLAPAVLKNSLRLSESFEIQSRTVKSPSRPNTKFQIYPKLFETFFENPHDLSRINNLQLKLPVQAP